MFGIFVALLVITVYIYAICIILDVVCDFTVEKSGYWWGGFPLFLPISLFIVFGPPALLMFYYNSSP